MSSNSTQMIRPAAAATVVLVRDADAGPEVLMLRRANNASFAPGAHVFPGGRVDPEDRMPGMADLCTGVDDAQASSRLQLAAGGLAYWVAAIRECFEEAGVLLVGPACENPTKIRDTRRQALVDGALTWAGLCREHDLQLATDRLRYLSRWITPPGMSRRFDTRFFLALAPAGQTAVACERETFEPEWIRPEQALDAARAGRIQIIHPTRKTLEVLSGHACAEAVLEAAPAAVSSHHRR